VRRAWAGVAVALATSALLAGCMRMPESGPVVETRSTGSLGDQPVINIDPRPPQQGASAGEIVKGFLDAMTATPIQTTVAREFLTKELSTSWDPQRRLITYADALPPRLRGAEEVTVRLTAADQLDSRLAWQGRLPKGQRRLDFPVTMENGEFRIAQAPNALIVPETWFEQRFHEVSLYFFDPSGQILVPEPVFVPSGEQLTTALVKGLLRGPAEEPSQVTRSYIPPGLDYGVSVAVSADGVADISLKGDAGPETTQSVERMLAQFAWTLRQDPSVRAVRVSIGGEPVQVRGGDSQVGVDQGAAFDPTGIQSSLLLYGLRNGVLVSGQPGRLNPVDGPLGKKPYGIRSLAVNLDATRVAGVSGGGHAVVVGPVHGAGSVRQMVSSADDLLRPAWDFANRLWLVDRTASGARVLFLTGSKVTSLQVPGVSGERVSRFLVSRDGSRLVAVVQRRSGDAIMVSRIRHDEQGHVLGASPAQRITWEGGGRLRIRDIGWHSPTSIAVLNLVGDQLAQVRSLAVDGSPAGLNNLSLTLQGNISALVASPTPGESTYSLTRTSLRDLSSPEQGLTPVERGTTTLTYVG
jgi:hypothetical protein